MSDKIHIGTILSTYIAENKISKMALARALGIDSSNLEVRLKKEFMRTDILLKICDILEHNFFDDITALMPAEFSVSINPDTTKDKRIAELELEVKMLQRERDVLSGLIRGRMG